MTSVAVSMRWLLDDVFSEFDDDESLSRMAGVVVSDGRGMRPPPSEPGTWAALDAGLRHEWLRLALGRDRFGKVPDRPPGSV
ncbi:hypothetical protein QLQ12_05220 [Actinoplanes sp. NEAU-A12]|uniref:Uncharacterized protein n=1 Tax=Actinoplanes sandaracinus TaxID=3045177 RepID=A0ABT6WE49_9ACTN|nr:hypothetical protein [Actinoplanes sandaracinus]MDI6098001.1 hypothetical protein [Actinoplanes sandaracinus]